MKAKTISRRKKSPSEGIVLANGPTETISATVPTALVRRVHERIGHRGFSQFVTRSIERELIRLNRVAFVEEVVRKTGPLDPAALEAARRLIRG